MGHIRKFNPGSQPPYTIGLMIAIGLVGLADLVTSEMMTRLFSARGIDIQYGQYWRLITMGFIHADFMHIAFNLLGLYFLGGAYERIAGGKWMLGVFFIAVLASSGMGSLVYDADRIMLGASGGVYGLFACVLAYYYAKIGSIEGMWQVPGSRMLLIWLGVGVYMSISKENVSLLGHVAGFVPGVILGYYYEHWYDRTADIYHKTAAVMVVALTVIVAAYASFPVDRASFKAVQAMKAYEAGRIERGDELLESAEDGKRQDDGTVFLLNHLKTWRNHIYKKDKDADVYLTWPLMHLKKVETLDGDYSGFLNPDAFGRTTVDVSPADVQDAGTKRENDGDK